MLGLKFSRKSYSHNRKISSCRKFISYSLVISISVLPLLMALKIPKALIEKPLSFCSHVEFEFYKTNSNEEVIQILFDKIPVKIEGASSSMMSKSDILNLTSWVRRTSDQHASDLKNYKPDFEKVFVDPITTAFE